MTAFKMTDGRATFLLACVRTHLTSVGLLPPSEHSLCADLRAWRDEPDEPVSPTEVVLTEETLVLAPGTYTVKVPPHGVTIEADRQDASPTEDSPASTPSPDRHPMGVYADDPPAAGVLERLQIAGGGLPPTPIMRTVARELEILYADDADNVEEICALKGEMSTVREEMASLRKHLGPSDGDC